MNKSYQLFLGEFNYELRDVVHSLLQTVTFKQATIDKLMHEKVHLKRLKFAAQSERFSAEQRSLLDETLDEGLHPVSRNNPNASPYQPTCYALRFTTNPMRKLFDLHARNKTQTTQMLGLSHPTRGLLWLEVAPD